MIQSLGTPVRGGLHAESFGWEATVATRWTSPQEGTRAWELDTETQLTHPLRFAPFTRELRTTIMEALWRETAERWMGAGAEGGIVVAQWRASHKRSSAQRGTKEAGALCAMATAIVCWLRTSANTACVSSPPATPCGTCG